MADVGVGRWVNSEQEVVDQFEQIHVRRRPEDFLDDFDEGQTHFLRDRCEMLIPMFLKTNKLVLFCSVLIQRRGRKCDGSSMAGTYL